MLKVHEDPQLQALIEKVHEADSCGNVEAQFTLNQELMTLAVERHDIAGILISKYYTCSALFDKVEFEPCEKQLMALLDDLKKHHVDLYLLRSYNLLAVIASECANYFESLNFYLQALHIANAHPDFKYHCILSNNIGKLFVELGEYESALNLLLQAYEQYHQEHSENKAALVTILLNVIECYGCTKQYEACYEWAKKTESFDEDEKRVVHHLLVANEIEAAFERHDHETIRQHVQEIIDHATDKDQYVYFFKLYLRILNVLIEIKEQKYCDLLMKAMDDLNKKKQKGTKIIGFLYEYADLKVRYYKTFLREHESKEQAQAILEEYETYSSQIINQLKNTYTHSMIVQLEKEQVELDKQSIIQENELLEKNIQLDTFTHIYNKISIRDHVEDALSKSTPTKKHALFVIDIDYFKGVNDTYGHPIGDEILLSVVSLLKRISKKNMLIGRFGGDEFIVFFTDYEKDEEVEAFAQKLVEQGREVIIPTSEQKYITFSVGVACTTGIDDFDSMFHKADKALYDRKHHGRDGFTFYGS